MNENTTPAQPTYEPSVGKKKVNVPAIIAGVLAALFLVLFLVTVSAPPKVETKVETKQVTPTACVEALDNADAIFLNVSKFLDSYGNSRGMDKATEELKPLVPKYRSAADECRASKG